MATTVKHWARAAGGWIATAWVVTLTIGAGLFWVGLAALFLVLLTGCNRGVAQRANESIAAAQGTAKSTLYQGASTYTLVSSEDPTASDFTSDGTSVVSPSPMTIATFGANGMSLADPKNTAVKGLDVTLTDENGQERARIRADEFGADNAAVIAARTQLVTALIPVFADAGETQRAEIAATIERIKAADPIAGAILEALAPLLGVP